jgi:hypothetical protein
VPEKAAQGLVKGCGWHGMQVGQGSLERPNQVWAIDFQFDQTSDREATEYLRMDNGPELIAWRCATGAGWRAPGPATLSRARPGRTLCGVENADIGIILGAGGAPGIVLPSTQHRSRLACSKVELVPCR